MALYELWPDPETSQFFYLQGQDQYHCTSLLQLACPWICKRCDVNSAQQVQYYIHISYWSSHADYCVK